jgi:hypothetical protein
MGKIFEFRPGSTIDRISGEAGVMSDSEFVQSEKGIAFYPIVSEGKVEFTPRTYNIDGADYSFEFWVKAKSLSGDFIQPVISNNQVESWIYFYGGNITIESLTPANFGRCTVLKTDEEWHHYVLCVSNGNISGYQDGISLPVIADDLSNDLTIKNIGYGGTGSGLLLGILGRVQIYDHILTEKERAKLYREFLRAAPTNKIIR